RRAASQRLDGHELGQDASTHARARRLDHGRKSGNLMVVPDDVAETRAREIQRRLDDPAFRRGGSVELVRGPELAAREMGVPDELDHARILSKLARSLELRSRRVGEPELKRDDGPLEPKVRLVRTLAKQAVDLRRPSDPELIGYATVVGARARFAAARHEENGP